MLKGYKFEILPSDSQKELIHKTIGCNRLVYNLCLDHKIKVNEFRRFDKVRYFGKDYFIKGRRTSGTGELMDVEGNKIDFSYMPKGCKTPSMKNMVRLSSRRSLMVQNVSL